VPPPTSLDESSASQTGSIPSRTVPLDPRPNPSSSDAPHRRRDVRRVTLSLPITCSAVHASLALATRRSAARRRAPTPHHLDELRPSPRGETRRAVTEHLTSYRSAISAVPATTEVVAGPPPQTTALARGDAAVVMGGALSSSSPKRASGSSASPRNEVEATCAAERHEDPRGSPRAFRLSGNARLRARHPGGTPRLGLRPDAEESRRHEVCHRLDSSSPHHSRWWLSRRGRGRSPAARTAGCARVVARAPAANRGAHGRPSSVSLSRSSRLGLGRCSDRHLQPTLWLSRTGDVRRAEPAAPNLERLGCERRRRCPGRASPARRRATTRFLGALSRAARGPVTRSLHRPSACQTRPRRSHPRESCPRLTPTTCERTPPASPSDVARPRRWVHPGARGPHLSPPDGTLVPVSLPPTAGTGRWSPDR
jgi:hypothetical protein